MNNRASSGIQLLARRARVAQPDSFRQSWRFSLTTVMAPAKRQRSAEDDGETVIIEVESARSGLQEASVSFEEQIYNAPINSWLEEEATSILRAPGS